jgi:hypothetical protein
MFQMSGSASPRYSWRRTLPIPRTRGQGISGRELASSAGIARLASEMISMARWTSQRGCQLCSNSASVRHALSLRRDQWLRGYHEARGRLCAPSKHSDGRAFDFRTQHGVQPVARRHINVDPEGLLEILLDSDEVEAVEPATGIIVDKEIQIASRLRFIACGRSEQIKRRCAESADRLGVPQLPRSGA